MAKLKISRNQWIETGYKLFAEEGEHGIVVDKLANILKCNKSSFYWRFNTKKNFINELVLFWANNETTEIIRFINQNESIQEKFRMLIALSFKKNPQLDFVFYLKRYALSDPLIQHKLYEMDCQRRDFVINILMEFGYDFKDSKQRTALFYKYLIGYHESIRYRSQHENYVDEVLIELKLFLDIDI